MSTDVSSIPAKRSRPFYRDLSVQILIATLLGILVGWLWPGSADAMKPLGDLFIRLVRMVVAPIIFCTVVHGIASAGQARVRIETREGKELADNAREAGIDLIRYQSVRDPGGGKNIAVLECDVFARPAPVDRQTWHLRFGSYGVQAICEFPRSSVEYPKEIFHKDKRTKKLDWDR